MEDFDELIENIKVFFNSTKKSKKNIRDAIKHTRYACKLHNVEDKDRYYRFVLGDTYSPEKKKYVIDSNSDKLRITYYNYMYKANVESMDQIPRYQWRLVTIQPIESILFVVIAMDCVHVKNTTIKSLSTRYDITEKIARKYYEDNRYLKNAQFGHWDR